MWNTSVSLAALNVQPNSVFTGQESKTIAKFYKRIHLHTYIYICRLISPLCFVKAGQCFAAKFELDVKSAICK